MKEAMSTNKKLIIAAVIILVVVAIIYFVTRSAKVNWKENPGGDIVGGQFDISIDESGMSVDAAKKKAEELGAKSFLMNGTRTIFKKVAGPVVTTTGGNWILYVKE